MPNIVLKSYDFRRAREKTWRELDRLIKQVEATGIKSLSPNDLTRLPVLYRATLSSLSVARSISLDQNVVRYLESLAGQAYFCVYSTRTTLRDAVEEFFQNRFPTAVRRGRWHILIAGLCLLLGVIAGFTITVGNEDQFYTFVSPDYAQGRGPTSSTAELREVLYKEDGGVTAALYTFATFLFTHNAKIGILSFALGFALGVPVIVLMFGNGLLIGAFVALYAGRGLTVEFLGWLLIHGTTELLAVMLCGGAGLVLAGSLAFPGRHTRLSELAKRGRMAGQIVLGAVVMFFIASLLEGLGRQLIHSTTLRWLVALGAVAFWARYFARAGRERLHEG